MHCAQETRQGREHRGIHRHIDAANESVLMAALLLTDTPTTVLSPPGFTMLKRSLAPNELQQLGERLRVAYGPVEAILPARLTELMERFARREHFED
jgi:hypothetical protein